MMRCELFLCIVKVIVPSGICDNNCDGASGAEDDNNDGDDWKSIGGDVNDDDIRGISL